MASTMALLTRSSRWFQTSSRLSTGVRNGWMALRSASTASSSSTAFRPSSIVAADEQFASQIEKFQQLPPDPERLYPLVVFEYLGAAERMTWMDLIKLRENEQFLRKLNPLIRWCFAKGQPNPIRVAQPVDDQTDEMDQVDDEMDQEQEQEEANPVMQMEDIAAEMEETLQDEDEAQRQQAHPQQSAELDDDFDAHTNSGDADAGFMANRFDKPMDAQYADALMVCLRKIANMTAPPSFMCEIYIRQFFLGRGKLEYLLEQHEVHRRSKVHGMFQHRLQLGHVLQEYVQRGRASELSHALKVCPALPIGQINSLLDTLGRWELHELLVDLYEHHEKLVPLRHALNPVPVLRAYDAMGRREDLYRLFNELDDAIKQMPGVEAVMSNLANKHQKRRNQARNRSNQLRNDIKSRREHQLPAQARAERERRQQD